MTTWSYGGHRSHGHAIAKGADINRLMAEIAGRATGYCGGKGGSMHIVAKETGFITATGVVGGTIPLALGAAFAAKGEETRPSRRGFFRRRRRSSRAVSRVAQHRQPLAVAGHLRLREQWLRRVHAAFGAHENRTAGAARQDLRNSGQHRRRQRSLRRARRDAESRGEMPRRQRTGIRRMLDPPHARPLRRRPGEIPRACRSSPSGKRKIPSRAPPAR